MEQTTNTSKSAVMAAVVAGKISTIIGWAVALFFLLCAIALVTTGAGYVIFCLVIVAIGVLLIVHGKKIKDRIRRFRKYIAIITGQNQTSIDQIANIIQMPVDFVLSDIKMMIDKKYFVGAYIDQSTNSIVLQHKAAAPVNNETNENAESNNEMQVVICKSCGAQNQIAKGTVGECEYCGSPLSSD